MKYLFIIVFVFFLVAGCGDAPEDNRPTPPIEEPCGSGTRVDLPRDFYEERELTLVVGGTYDGENLEAIDIVIKIDDVSEGQNEGVSAEIEADGTIRCYKQLIQKRQQYRWLYCEPEKKWVLKEVITLEEFYGPKAMVDCPPPFQRRTFGSENETDVDPCESEDFDEDDVFAKRQDFYDQLSKKLEQTITVISTTQTVLGVVEVIRQEKTEIRSEGKGRNKRCFERFHYQEVRIYWTFCQPTGKWIPQRNDVIISIWGPWRQVECLD